MKEREFHHKVLKVEERFRAELTEEAIAKLGVMPGAEAGAEGKYEPTMVSTGWWVVLDGWPVAMCFGSGKPDIQSGETLVLIARRIPKPPPELTVVSPAPTTLPSFEKLKQMHAEATPEIQAIVGPLIAEFEKFLGPTP